MKINIIIPVHSEENTIIMIVKKVNKKKFVMKHYVDDACKLIIKK